MQLEIKHVYEDLGVTVVYVTHDQGGALTMSDRIAVFNGGVIRSSLRCTSVRRTPSSPGSSARRAGCMARSW